MTILALLYLYIADPDDADVFQWAVIIDTIIGTIITGDPQ